MPAGILALGVGVLLQLYVAGVNYSTNAPEGYNPAEDAKVRHMCFRKPVRCTQGTAYVQRDD